MYTPVNLDNKDYPYITLASDGIYYPVDNVMMAVRFETEEEAKELVQRVFGGTERYVFEEVK